MAKRYIDKSLEEQRAERSADFSKRMQNIAQAGSGMLDRVSQMATGLAKEEVFGIPGLLGDLAKPASVVLNPILYGSSPEVRENVSQFEKDFGAVGLAARAGVELSDEFLDEKGELRPEMAGRLLAPGALYTKGATLLPKAARGLQDLVSGLKANDFFPPNGPQLNPVTVAPDPRTTFPMYEAPVPDTSVMLSEARGTGSTDAGLIDSISKGEINTPEDIKRLFPDFRILNPEDFPDQAAYEYAEKSAQYKLINQYGGASKEKKIKKTLAPNQETYMVSEEGASKIGDAHSPLLDVLKKINIPSGGIAGSSVIEQVGKQLSKRRNIELEQYGLADYFSRNADKKFSREELIETFDAVAPNIDVKTVMERDLQSSSPSLAYQTPDGVNDAAGPDGHGVIVFGNKKGAQLGGVKLKGVPGHDYFKDDIDGFFGQLRFSIVPDPYNPGSGRQYMSINEAQTDIIRGQNDLAEGRDTEYARRMIQDERVPITPAEKLAFKDLDESLEASTFGQLEKKAFEIDEETRLIQGGAKYRAARMSDGAPHRNTRKARIEYDDVFKAVNEGLYNQTSPEAAEGFLLRLFPGQYDDARREYLMRNWTSARENAEVKLRSLAEQGIATTQPGLLNRLMGGTQNPLQEGLKAELFTTLQAHQRFFDRAKVFEDLTRYKDDLTKTFLKGVKGDNETVMVGLKGTKVSNARSKLTRDEVLAALPKGWYDETVANLVQNYKDIEKEVGRGAFPYKGLRGYKPTTFSKTEAEGVVDDVIDFVSGGGVPRPGLIMGAGDFRSWLSNKNFFDAKETRMQELQSARPLDSDIQDAKDSFFTRIREKGGIENFDEIMELRDKTVRTGGSKGYMQDVPFKTQNAFNQFALRAAVREAEKMGLSGVVVPDWADMSVMSGRLDDQEFTLGSQLDIEAPAFNEVATKIDEVVQREAQASARIRGEEDVDQFKSDYVSLTDMKKILDDVDEKARDTILQLFDLRPSKEPTDGEEILKRYYNPQLFNEETGLGTETLENLGEDTLVNISSLKRGMEDRISNGLRQTKKYRAFKTNYGDVLDAALQRLVSEGVSVEVKPFGLYNPRENKIEPFGRIKRPARVIELTGKTKDIAKKVPSAYNKGGHVDVRGGIGAMARSVM